MSRANQVSMEGPPSLPTMRVLFDAPITSPLNEIDVEDVGMFFVHLTREDMLQSHDANKKPVDILASSTTSVHDSLANLVSNEILSAPDAYQSKVLIKVLTSLQLTPNNYVHLRGLKVLSEQLLVTVKERTAVKQVEKGLVLAVPGHPARSRDGGGGGEKRRRGDEQRHSDQQDRHCAKSCGASATRHLTKDQLEQRHLLRGDVQHQALKRQWWG